MILLIIIIYQGTCSEGDDLTMKVLNIEDTPIKHHKIRSTLEDCRVYEVDCKRNLEAGIIAYKSAIEEGKPYDLIITDMWYPPAPGIHEDRCGDRLISIAKEEGWKVPIIICSNQNYDYPEIYGCLYYSENEDWEGKLRNYINMLKSRK